MRMTRRIALALGFTLLLAAPAWAGSLDPVVASDLLPANPGIDPDAVLANGPGTRDLYLFSANRLWSLPDDTTSAWHHEPDPPVPFTPRTRPVLAWDPGAQRLLVYGGQSAGGALSDLWAFDPATDTWTQLETAMTPGPALGAYTSSFDPTGNRTVVLANLAGIGSPTLWALSLAPNPVWVEIPTTGMPAFAVARIACDSNANRLLVFAELAPFADLRRVWSVDLSGGAWSILPTTNAAPFRLGQEPTAALVGFDAARDALFAFKVDRGTFAPEWSAARLQLADTSTWYAVPAFPTPGVEANDYAVTSSGGFDRRTKRFQAWLPNVGLCEAPIADLMQVSLRAWSETFPLRFGGYDPASRAFWFHGGDLRRIYRQSFDETLDVERYDVAAPMGFRSSPGVAYDPADERLLFFGGALDGVPQLDLRALVPGTPPVWLDIATAGPPPPPRHDPRIVLDTRRHRLVVLDVVDDGGPTFPVLDLAAVPPTWSRLPVLGAELLPGWRWDAVYDSTSDRILAVDDSTGAVPFGTGRTRSIDLAVSPAVIAALPDGRGNSESYLTLDRARRLLVETGGVNHFQTVREVWVLPLDKAEPWRMLASTGDPFAIGVEGGISAYDPVRDRIVVLGGFSCYALGGQTGRCWSAHGMAVQFDPQTPTRLDFAEAEVVSSGIRVLFAGEGSSGEVRVERSSDRGASWEARGVALEVSPGLWEYVDADAVPGVPYRYRGRYDDGNGERTTAWSPDVTRPTDGAVTLALAPRAGAVVRGWPVEFAVTLVPGGGAATLELVDVTGRVVVRQRIDAGASTVALAPERAAGAGLYFARLRQGSNAVTTRIVRL